MNPQSNEPSIIILPSGKKFNRKTFSKYTDDELKEIISECNNIAHILRTLEINQVYHRKIKDFIHKNKISTTHFKTTYVYTAFNGNKIKSNQQLKKNIIKEGKLVNKCAICNLEAIWNNKPLVLQLDHINGNNFDDRIDNLRLLCPNCHTQTDTYTGRNVKNKSEKINVIPYISENKIITNKGSTQPLKCISCEAKITKQSKTGMCEICQKKSIRVVERPSYDILLKEVNELGYLQVGKKYGVSDNSIRKWLKNYTKLSTK